MSIYCVRTRRHCYLVLVFAPDILKTPAWCDIAHFGKPCLKVIYVAKINTNYTLELSYKSLAHKVYKSKSHFEIEYQFV